VLDFNFADDLAIQNSYSSRFLVYKDITAKYNGRSRKLMPKLNVRINSSIDQDIRTRSGTYTVLRVKEYWLLETRSDNRVLVYMLYRISFLKYRICRPFDAGVPQGHRDNPILLSLWSYVEAECSI